MSDTTQQYEPGNHPDLPPPSNTVGPIHWMKENLFSTPTNIALTLLSVYLIYAIIPTMLDWAFLNAAFEGESRKDCKAIASGACWAFIDKRLTQFIYGFYPEESRWRVNLFFLTLGLALWPVLFDNAPARNHLIKFSLAFPLIALLLVYGPINVESMRFENLNADREIETGFGPIVWMAMLVGGIAARIYGQREGKDNFYFFGTAAAGLTIVVFLISQTLWWGLPDMLGMSNSAEQDYFLPVIETSKFGGIMLTIVIGVTGIVGSLPIGVVLALGRQSRLPIIKVSCVAFIEFIRGVPLITLLFVASTMLNYFLPPGTVFDLLLRVLIMVVLFAAGYIAEVVRGGLQALPKGQKEAADALGLTYWQAMRLIILPQALKISIPGIVNTFIGLFKDSTLVIIIGLFDPLGVGKAAVSDAKWAGLAAEVYVFIAVFFFISCFGMSRYSLYLEKKLHTGHKR